MNIVAVTRTGNENDIIEPFVRHHAALLDLMIIIDDNSTDGTFAILEALRAEGLPLLLLKADEVDWPQIDFVTRMMHLAFDRYDAAWVAPLDADEFLELPPGKRLADMLPATFDHLIQLRWRNFAWHRSIPMAEKNPVVRMRMRMPARTDSCKVIVPRDAVRGDPDACLLAGNHELRSHGRYVDLVHKAEIILCHYPIRSVQQFLSKSVINYLRYTALPNGPETAGFQYEKPFDLAKGGSAIIPAMMAEMERESQVYAMQAGGRMIGEPAEQPLAYRGGPLTHSVYPESAFANIVNHAEALARRIARLEGRRGS